MNWQELSFSDPWIQTLASIVALVLGCVVAQWLARHVIVRALAGLRGATRSGPIAVLLHPDVLTRVAQIVPTLVVQVGIRFVPNLPEKLATVTENVAAALSVLFAARALFKALEVALGVYEQRAAEKQELRSHSIKSYVQLGQILVGIAAVVVMIAALADKSPLIVLSGFGAMSAVLMLIFQDTIKSFTAGMQIEGNDMLRVGDWIEMPQAGADGDVIDIALNTVKVQNWDKTIVTIPTWKLMSESFKNWRGMSEAGGRRIKRTLMLDAGTIHFLQDEEIERLGQIEIIAEYVQEKARAVKVSRGMRARELGEALAQVPANQRRLTNIGTFRAYVLAYLKANADIRKDMTIMVRLMQPTPEGVPLEIYCFTNTTAWVAYEAIQGDIFDHLLAILPEFALGSFQSPGGGDFRALLEEEGSPARLPRQSYPNVPRPRPV
ncbi:mechanosensitive ion channel family protein [Ottowia thiooxydans]|uniref:mechanosensitive ion channel family protein n=1 Tax=Ottowia thiooxydans TaxID=219182 RepID=UPI0004049A92|nr:mechanosensitive ion channel family protein [Ottowia thiooxydans]